MRRGYHDTSILQDNNVVIGVNLGWDFAAEHEWGISEIRSAFGLQSDKFGFEARRNTIVPNFLFNRSIDSSELLVYSDYLDDDNPEGLNRQIESLVKGELRFYKGNEIVGAWDSHSFGVRINLKDKDDITKNTYQGIIRELYDSFQNKKGVITFCNGTGILSNKGLALLNYDRIPEELKDKFREDDRASKEKKAKFRSLEEESGVFDLLEKSGKRFYSLSIREYDEDGSPLWWLNPAERGKYHAGWYHTEDLKKWAENKGPVIGGEY